MSRPKSKPQYRKTDVEQEMEIEIEFECPVRGLVKQKVKGTKFKPLVVSRPRYTVEDFTDSTGASVEEEDN
jgi:hypothetical protein